MSAQSIRASVYLIRWSDGHEQRRDGDPLINQGSCLRQCSIAVNLLRFDLAGVDLARSVGELIADPARLLQHLRLHGSQPAQRAVRSLPWYPGRHRCLAHVGRLAKGTNDEI